MVALALELSTRARPSFKGGPAVATIVLSANTISEDAALGVDVGTLSVINATGTPSFTLVDSAGSRFALSGAIVERGATALDYETATSHNIIVSATGTTPLPSNATLTINVTDVSVETAAGALLAAESTGLAFAASDDTMEIKDTVTPANNYSGTPGAKLTISRGSTAYYYNASSLLASSAINTLRRDKDPRLGGSYGYHIEESRTNVVLWNRDLTNAAWVKTTCTAVKDQTGADGVANSASKITATSANGTCLQTTSIASSARWMSCFIKRVTGSGNIQITQNNGSTWTTVTVTGAWTVVEAPTVTAANPIVGFRIVTSGDAVAIDMVQNENNGLFRSSPIPTTTAATTRAADSVSIATTAFNWQTAALTHYVRYMIPANIGTGNHRVFMQDSRICELYLDQGTPQIYGSNSVAIGALTNPPALAIHKIACAGALNSYALSLDGAAVVEDTATTAMAAVGTLYIGSFTGGSDFLTGWMLDGMHLPRRMTNAELVTRAT